MIIFAKSDGTIRAIAPSPFNQGSVDVNDIYLLAPFISSAAVYASFRLPNGILLTPRLVLSSDGENLDAQDLNGSGADYGYKLVLVDGFDGAFADSDGNVYNLWHITLDAPLTQFSGSLKIQFYVVTGISVMALNECTVEINRGVPYLDPSITEADINNITGWLSAANLASTVSKTYAIEAGKSANEAAESAEQAQEVVKDVRILSGNLFKYELSESQNYIITGFNTDLFTPEEIESVKILTFPDSYAGKPVKEISDFAFYEKSHIECVIFPKTITKIGESAFAKTSLLQIELPDNVSQIGSEAFADLNSLTLLTIKCMSPSGISSDMLARSYLSEMRVAWSSSLSTSTFGAGAVNSIIYGFSLSNKMDKPSLSFDANYTLPAINGAGDVIPKDYSNKAEGNTIVQRTGGGGAKFIAQYGAADAVANITMLEIAQTMSYVDSFTNAAPSYPYKPYWFAAKGWGATISLPEGTITDLPQDPSTEWYQKVVNAHDNSKTIILQNGVQFNGTNYTKLNQCVGLYTDKATHADSPTETHPAGREDLRIIIAPHSTINIRCRNRPSGYTQIWIT